VHWGSHHEPRCAMITDNLERSDDDSIRSASFRTDVNKILTLLGKSRRSISKAIGVGFTKGMDSISLAPKCHVQARFSARF
jgi:hypothetical protein